MELPPSESGLLIHVVADDREAKSEVLSALSGMDDVCLSVRRLATGDYEVDQRCLFERKTVVDFTHSIKDGRLFSQACRLARAKVPCALILEGRSGDLAATGMRREALQGAIISLSLIYEIPVLRSLDSSETARLIVYAAKQLHREATGTVQLHGKRPKRRRKIQLRLLQGLPGIGPGRAEDLLIHFGSVASVMMADHKDLKSVKGIGEKTAAAIRWALEVDAPKQ